MTTIDMKMSAIYRASHDELPDQAGQFSIWAGSVSDSAEPIVKQVGLAGNHPIGDDTADLAVELFRHLRSVVRTINDSATALDGIADDFTKRDEQAQAWMQQHRRYLGDPDNPTIPSAPRV